ncbi:hypothetical protein BDN72DRAFT_845133 [Pluteus cervinus]|uniref:Uncharacterized protein n=1 Tax=Pluteus cervinus TaxID=181527 RepID=A0ACD3AJ80_9AGAR|nr:hypothetical protein BDN72DRAFT_845133 [Pluteus cervinus]
MAIEYSTDQLAHDEVNLHRLVRRLEKAAAEQSWDERKANWTWIQAQGMVQKVRYARKLMKNIEVYGPDLTPHKTEVFETNRSKLDKVEAFARDVEQRVQPKVKRGSLLSGLSLPVMPQSDDASSSKDEELSVKHSELSDAAGEILSSLDGISTPSEVSFTSLVPTLIPSTLPPSSKSTATTALSTSTGTVQRFGAGNSTALQQELSEQLAQMASQLKRNAEHFSESLEKDAQVVEAMQQKLEGNFDTMQKERIRLRDHTSKSRGTTCLVMAIVMTVLLLFMLMVSIIRFSRI